MLTDRERDALRQWYRLKKIRDESELLIGKRLWEELEEHLQMRCLFALSRHSELPDFMRDDEGKPLFPTNLNPGKDLEKWQDAIEVAWEVIEEDFGLSHDDVHKKIAREQKDDWANFLGSVEERRKARD
jgi:hypothetical protein